MIHRAVRFVGEIGSIHQFRHVRRDGRILPPFPEPDSSRLAEIALKTLNSVRRKPDFHC